MKQEPNSVRSWHYKMPVPARLSVETTRRRVRTCACVSSKCVNLRKEQVDEDDGNFPPRPLLPNFTQRVTTTRAAFVPKG